MVLIVVVVGARPLELKIASNSETLTFTWDIEPLLADRIRADATFR